MLKDGVWKDVAYAVTLKGGCKFKESMTMTVNTAELAQNFSFFIFCTESYYETCLNSTNQAFPIFSPMKYTYRYIKFDAIHFTFEASYHYG